MVLGVFVCCFGGECGNFSMYYILTLARSLADLEMNGRPSLFLIFFVVRKSRRDFWCGCFGGVMLMLIDDDGGGVDGVERSYMLSVALEFVKMPGREL